MAIRDLIPWRKTRREDEGLVPLDQEFRDLFRETFGDMFRPWHSALARRRWPEMKMFTPAVDVRENENEYVISADVPGLEKDDLEVSISEGRVIISGEKREEKKKEAEDYLSMERSYGSFRRTIPLPSSVDEDSVEAQFKNGVLQVRLPKTEQARGKRVDVRAA